MLGLTNFAGKSIGSFSSLSVFVIKHLVASYSFCDPLILLPIT